MLMWDEQFARMERYYRRCQNIKEHSSLATLEEDNNTIYSFFVHCHHLKDWFKQDPCYQHRRNDGGACDNGACAECYVRKTPALKLCQEISNAIKHLNSSEIAPVAGTGGSYVDGSVWFFVRWPDGTQRDTFEVIDGLDLLAGIRSPNRRSELGCRLRRLVRARWVPVDQENRVNKGVTAAS